LVSGRPTTNAGYSLTGSLYEGPNVRYRVFTPDSHDQLASLFVGNQA